MLHSLLILLLMQLAGDLATRLLHLPVPGMVIGLATLLAVLVLRGWMLGEERAIPPTLGATAAVLHGNLGLLFVPAGVGILAHLDLLAAEGPAILSAVIVSTALALWLTAVIAAGLPSTSGQAQEERP